jgi:hypothetical protein
MAKRLPDSKTVRRANEKGAALVIALLLSLLLLLIGGALITSTMMSATNMLDATPEVQAYYGAESGLQAALLALRGNSAPNPLFVTNPLTGGVADANKLDFRGAVTPSISNLSSDPTTAGFPTRLSRWLPYSYTPSGGTYADRVPVSPGAYNPLNGIAYSLAVQDPDNSQVVTFSTAGVFNNGTNTVTFGSSGNTLTLTYNAQPSTTLTALPSATSNLGSITVATNGTGASLPGGTQLTLRVNVDAPFKGYMLMGGTLSGSATSTTSSLKITFGNVSVRVRGTLITLVDASGNPSNPYPLSFSLFPTVPLRVSVTAPVPERLLITSTGYGPRGARKVLMMEAYRYLYNISPPSPLVIRGSDTAGDITTFDLGSSNAKYYSGKDAANIQAQQPTIAISRQDWSSIYTGMGKGATIADPKLSILDLDPILPWPASLTPVPSSTPVAPQPAMPPPAQTPDFLQTADAARAFLNDLQTAAVNSTRYYTAFDGYADAGNDLVNVNNPALTFVDGDCTLSGGSGLLVVTGTLTLKGTDDFRGIILVMGTGKVLRSGSGSANVLGAWIVAKFPRTGTGGFTAPYFDVSGGGNGSFLFDTKAIDDALRMLGMKVVGVAET